MTTSHALVSYPGTIGNGTAVHVLEEHPHVTGGIVKGDLCGTSQFRTGRKQSLRRAYHLTMADVTCTKCLKALAAR